MKQMLSIARLLWTALMLGALLFVGIGVTEQVVPVFAASQVVFDKDVNTPMAQVGEIVTFTLRMSITPGPPVYVRVYDPNPAPQYLEVLSSTITGGAVYSPTIDGLEWEYQLSWGDDPVELSFQAHVIGLPDPLPAGGIVITNVAMLVDPTPNGSLPRQRAEASFVLASLERQFLPLVLESDSVPEPQTDSELLALRRRTEAVRAQGRLLRHRTEAVHAQGGLLRQVPQALRVDRSEFVGRRAVWAEADYLTMLPLVWNDDCRPGRTVESPFGLEIAALHQIMPPQALRVLGEPAWPQAAFPTLIDALEQSGAGWTRVHISWKELQPEPPDFDSFWLDWYDQRLALVAGTGVRIIATVADAPEWAADVPCAPIHADRLDDFGQFLEDLVQRYGQPPYNIRHWELINEPDSTWRAEDTNGLGCWADASTDQDGRQYADTLAVASRAIRNADPEATVLMGGVAHDWFTEAPYNGLFDRYFPDDVMTHGGGGDVDALNIHYFRDWHAEWERWDPDSEDRRNGWLNAPTCGDLFDGEGTTYEAYGVDLHAKATHFSNRMSACFGVNKPLWVTELAEHGFAGNPASLAGQAQYVIQGYARGLAAGVQNITWYALTTPNDPYEQGLLYDDWTPKPAFFAYQTMTAELAGYEYTSTLTLAGAEVYVFSDPCGREKTVAWGSGTLHLASVQKARIVDRWGLESFVLDGGPGDDDGVRNGAIALGLSSEPAFVSVVQ